MKNKGCFIALLLTAALAAFFVFGIKIALTPRDLSREDPRKAFEDFVCSPMPHSVHEINASGTVAFAGGHADMDFKLDPRDHDDLIRRGGFKFANDRVSARVLGFGADGDFGNIARYVRINGDGLTQTELFVSEDHRRAWFRETQF